MLAQAVIVEKFCFSKPVKFYGVNIACFMLRMHEKLPGQHCTKDKHCAEQRPVMNGQSSSVSTYCLDFRGVVWV